jgi:hypothetical protein
VIKSLRQQKVLSQRALAAQVGVTDAYKQIAMALGVPVTELLG